MKTYPMKARIRNEGSGPARVDIFDDIGAGGWFSEGFTPATFADQVRGIRGPLDVHISSSGGDVFDGLAIADAIRSHPGGVTTYVDGIAASIASVIAQAGQQRVMTPGSMLMIHDASSFAAGNEADLAKMAQTLGKVSDNLAQQYATRAGGTAAQWREAMQAETWYTADEAVAAGLADKVGSGSAALPQGVDLDALAAHVPVRIMAQLRAMPRAAAAPEPYEGDDPCPTCKGKKTIRDGNMACPDCKGSGKAPAGDAEDRAPRLRNADGGQDCKTCGGSGRLKHPGTGKNGLKCPGCAGTGTYDPDGDGDDDSSAEGDTDHDYVEPDGSPGPSALDDRLWAFFRQALRGVRGAVDNSPWDGPKAMSNGAAADDPAAFYAGICAGKKDGDPKLQSSWALPYRYHPDDPPNTAGVKAGLAALGGARGGVEGLTNEAEARKTLQAAMKQVNPDYEPEDSTDSVFSRRLKEMRGAMPPLKGADA